MTNISWNELNTLQVMINIICLLTKLTQCALYEQMPLIITQLNTGDLVSMGTEGNITPLFFDGSFIILIFEKWFFKLFFRKPSILSINNSEFISEKSAGGIFLIFIILPLSIPCIPNMLYELSFQDLGFNKHLSSYYGQCKDSRSWWYIGGQSFSMITIRP